MGNISSVLTLFSVTTQILVIGSILITILIYLSLRKKSLAVLRALGAPKRYIFASVWLQIFLIIFTGSFAGLAMGYGVTALSSRILSSFSGLFIRAAIGLQEIFLVLIVLGAGSVLAVIPAFLIYRQSAGTALSADL